MTHLTVEEAAKATKKGRHARAVAEAVLPGLIARGVVRGIDVDGIAHVVDDEAFRATMRLGIERFHGQGWSFVAADAPVDAVADHLRGRPGVVGYEQGTRVGTLKDGLTAPTGDPRDYFLVATARGRGSVLIQTVHWISLADMAMGLLLAAELSAALRTRTLAAWDDDFSGATLVTFEGGERTAVLSDAEEDSRGPFHIVFYERGISLPDCFIAEGGGRARLHARPAAEVIRADRVAIEIPPELRSDVPHVFSKLGMMGTATGGGDFHSLLVDGLQARARPAAGPGGGDRDRNRNS